MGVFENSQMRGHEQVLFATDAATGLKAIIAIHSTVPGFAGGGVRFFPYAGSDAALTDALRLSRAMTYKMALAGLPFGGGKSVIIGDPRQDKSEALLEAFGRAVDSLGGRYVCGEDVGTTEADMAVIRRATKYVAGLPDTTGDPSRATALGIFQAIRAAARHRFGRDELAGTTVAVQGLGNVGGRLCGHLAGAGAKLLVADTDTAAVETAIARHGATAVDPGDILEQRVDVLAPCALGGVLDDATIGRLNAAVVCGGANNQLAEDRHAGMLADRGILFVPDFLANAGGAIDATGPFLGRNPAETRRATEAIYDTCARVLALATETAITPNEAAERLAEERLGAARETASTPPLSVAG